ncbi:MAG: leucine-rich repeat domain-containing protein, partial [Candidatus Babeliales bacterium]|nr:leucine-rich repeat domain-containing protein [Candidatus Babeliales bacterium]
QIQDDLSLKKALECFAASVYLDFVPLANVYADQIAQHLFNEDRTFNKNNLVSVIDLFLMNSSLIDSWYLIEKFYYLRSNELRANIDNLLLNYIPELIEVLDINPGNLNYMRLNIIKKFYLSINDLIDYDKIKLDADEIIINNFSLVSIDGLKRIPNINDFNVIDVSNNLLADLGDNFQDLNDLDVLMLSHNALTDLGSNLQGLNSLTFLDLSFNQIITLGDSLQQLVALETLHLNNNLLTNLSNSLHFLIQLKSLSLHFNQLTNLGNSLHGFNALKFLSLSNNQLTNLGDSLNRLIALEELFLSNNQLNNLDGRLNGLTNLRELYLSDNTITDLGVSLQDLNNLKILDLSNNALVSLGYNSERILNLEILNVDTIQLNQESSDLVANWRAIHEGQNV